MDDILKQSMLGAEDRYGIVGLVSPEYAGRGSSLICLDWTYDLGYGSCTTLRTSIPLVVVTTHVFSHAWDGLRGTLILTTYACEKRNRRGAVLM